MTSRRVNDAQDISFFREAAKEALKSTCLRRKCGSVLVFGGRIVGKGFNSPPRNLESQRRCICSKSDLHAKVTDKTCCIHAEQRAIIDALTKSPDEVKNSVLYFTAVDGKGDIIRSGNPYCTICSKLALEVGVAQFALWHPDPIAIRLYNTQEYNLLSFKYSEE